MKFKEIIRTIEENKWVQVAQKNMEQYVVIIERSSQNYSAYSPDVLGCVAAGNTIEETLQAMNEALIMHLEGLAEDGDELPHARGLKYYLSQDVAVAEPGDLTTHIDVTLPVVA